MANGTQSVTLDVGALGTDSTSVTLGGGGSTNLTLRVGTDTGDAGEEIATVSSANETTSATATVLTPARSVVSNLTAPTDTVVRDSSPPGCHKLPFHELFLPEFGTVLDVDSTILPSDSDNVATARLEMRSGTTSTSIIG